MRHVLVAALVALSPLPAQANDLLETALNTHVLPGFGRLEANAAVLAEAAAETCDPQSPRLVEAFHDAWDSWIAVSHLRFGPTEAGNRAFALGFWPDTRGVVPKSLARLIADEDPIVADPVAFLDVSVAARGFTALEFLLFDPALADGSDYHCALIRAVTEDIAITTAAIAGEWQGAYGAAFLAPGSDGAPFRTESEALAALYSAMTTGLEFTADARLGRPLGTFERPRPKRAEARRANRSLRHVLISVQSNAELAGILSAGHPEEAAEIAAAFDRAVDAALRLDDPAFASVAEPAGRFRVEALQQRVREARDAARLSIGPRLGIAEGFNALDGD